MNFPSGLIPMLAGAIEELRLGDIIDDHCGKCGMATNHSVVAIVNGEPARTRCRTCYDEHTYRRGKGGKKKASSRKADLFEQVLSKIQQPPGSSD